MKKTIFLLISGWFVTTARAQTIERYALTCFGEAVNLSGVSYAWTAGECLTQSYSNGPAALILTQGYLQPEKQDFLSVGDIPTNDIGLQIYPNPTTEALYVRSSEQTPLRIRIYDAAGKLMYEQPTFAILTDPLVVSAVSWPAGSYFLHVESKKKGIRPVTVLKLR